MIQVLSITFVLWLMNIGLACAFSVDEAFDGDLSGHGAIPSNLILNDGVNTLVGSAGVGDYDIFQFFIPTNLQLTNLRLNHYSASAGVSFLGIQQGTTWSAGTGNGVNGNLLSGWTLFGANNIGDDLLATANTTLYGASGFDIPLTTGDYVFLIQDTGGGFNYDLSFVAAPVPLPAAVLLFLSGFATLFVPLYEAKRIG